MAFSEIWWIEAPGCALAVWRPQEGADDAWSVAMKANLIAAAVRAMGMFAAVVQKFLAHQHSPIEAPVVGRRRTAAKLLLRVRQSAEAALHALGLVTAVAFAFLLPDAGETRARIERAVALQVAQENREFCERRGLRTYSYEHTVCVLELNRLRANHERRVLEPRAIF